MTPNPVPPPEPRKRPATISSCPECGRPLRIVQQTTRAHRMKPGVQVIEYFARCARLIPHRFVAWVEVGRNGSAPDPVFRSTKRR